MWFDQVLFCFDINDVEEDVLVVWCCEIGFGSVCVIVVKELGFGEVGKEGVVV